MRTETWPIAGWADESPSGGLRAGAQAEVTVLAGGRIGARLLPLTRTLARQAATVGAEVAVTANLLDQLPLAQSVVVTIPPDTLIESCVDSMLSVAAGILGGQALTVAVACPSPTPHGMLPETRSPEALRAAIADARRHGLVTTAGNTVLLVRELVPTVASVLASHNRATSNVRPHRRPLGRDTIRQLTALARDAAVTAGTTLSLDIALGSRGPVVLRCRPSTP